MEVFTFLHRLLGQVYLVGGAVRDLLRGQTPKDFDFTTPLPPGEVVERFRGAGLPLNLRGLEHGVVATVLEGQEAEVATFRVDVATDGRRAQVAFTASLEADLARRDFTINAMALGVDGTLFDPFGGRRDLEQGWVRAVGAPAERFREDYIRPLRALRFAAQLGFEIEAGTWAAAQAVAPEVPRRVAFPRMGEELTRGFVKGRGRFVRLLLAAGLLYELFPELVGPHGPGHVLPQNPLYHPEGDVVEHTAQVLDRMNLDNVEEGLAAWAAFLHDVGKPATAQPTGEGWYRFPDHDGVGEAMVAGIARRFAFSNAWKEALEKAVGLHMRPLQAPTVKAVRRFQAAAGPHLPLLRAVCFADGEGRREDLEAWFAPQEVPLEPLVRGRDLLTRGVPPGPGMGELLRKAWELQLEGLGREEILARLLGEVPTW